MSAQREGRAYWLDLYPLEEKLLGKACDDMNEVLFVDMGGALGSEIRELQRGYPALKGRMILQDLPQTIEHVSEGPRLEAMVHDLFTPQPIKGSICLNPQPCPANTISRIGARIYYLRNILHDWPTPFARHILEHIHFAMTLGISRLLINKLVVPLQGGGLFAPHSDLNMMSICAGMERTEAQWRELLGSVGLDIVGIWTGEVGSESLIETVVLIEDINE